MAKKEQEMYEGMPVIEASDGKSLEKKLEQMESRPEKVVVRISSRAKKIKESAFPLVEFAGIQSGLQVLKIVQTNDIAIVLIPDSVTEIGRGAFRGCTGLTSIVIPDSVTKIGDSAFNGSGLINIVIPKSIKNIGLDAFMDCNNCVSISVMGPVNFLQYNVFANCMKLETITFGTGIKKIDPGFLKVYNKNSDNVRIGSKYDFPPTLKAIYVPAKKTDYYKQRLPQFLHSIIVEKQ